MYNMHSAEHPLVFSSHFKISNFLQEVPLLSLQSTWTSFRSARTSRTTLESVPKKESKTIWPGGYSPDWAILWRFPQSKTIEIRYRDKKPMTKKAHQLAFQWKAKAVTWTYSSSFLKCSAMNSTAWKRKLNQGHFWWWQWRWYWSWWWWWRC